MWRQQEQAGKARRAEFRPAASTIETNSTHPYFAEKVNKKHETSLTAGDIIKVVPAILLFHLKRKNRHLLAVFSLLPQPTANKFMPGKQY